MQKKQIEAIVQDIINRTVAIAAEGGNKISEEEARCLVGMCLRANGEAVAKGVQPVTVRLAG